MSSLIRSSWLGAFALVGFLGLATLSGCQDGKTALVVDEDTALTDISEPDSANTPPTLAVDLPDDGAVIRIGESLAFQLSYSDLEDGAKGTVSYEDIPGDVSAASETDENGVIKGEITDLPAGKHVLTFRAKDSGGLEAEASVTVLVNTAPGAPVVTIEPENPNTTHDLVATVIEASQDPDRASDDLKYTFSWTYTELDADGNESDLIESDITGDTVPSTKTVRGQTWHVKVRANDGTDDSTVAEASTTVGNAPPTEPEVSIEPFEANITSKLECTATANDPDGGVPSITYAWRVNEATIENKDANVLDLTAELSVVDADGVESITTIQAGDEVYCVATASDDDTSSEPASSPVVILADYDTCADDVFNVCSVDATCANNGTIKVDCTCNEGFEGDGLDCLNADDCDPNPCLNDGLCEDGVSSYSCECAAGFEGDICDVNVDDCDPNPCQNSGLCTDGDNAYTCSCELGFEGDNCEVNINECEPNPCLNGGGCTDDIASYTCECVVGYSGTDCETNIDECDPDPCQNGGTCEDGVASYTCACEPGFAGKDCEVDVDDCIGSPCQNGGTCTDAVNGFTCECPDGFSGANCQTNIDDCDPNPCLNEGTCIDGIDSFTCSCPVGFAGETCADNVNDCAGEPCLNGATCTDDVDGYSCECPAGFEGVHCELNIDDCAKKPCLNGGSCIDGIDSFTCQCAPGFDGDLCANDIDECAKKPCQNGGTCIDAIASYSCECAKGWAGVHCEENIDECAKKPCLNGATCTDGIDSFTCICAAGFEGELCGINIDDCAKKPCLNGACIDDVNGFSCQCNPGFEGELCDINIDECAKKPCLNGGTCVDKVNGYLCECPLGFEGGDCEVNIDDCKPNPCKNGGQCEDGIANFSCKCPAGFDGDVCENNIDDCAKKPCQNGGTCNDGVNAYTCTCPPGFGGINCEINADDCDPNPCVNGKCKDGADGYQCDCEPGWGGSNCEVNIDDCAVEPCQNGVCVDGDNSFSCLCDEGWTGKDCSEDVDECKEGAKCFENSYCANEIGGYTCICKAGYAKVGGACYSAPQNAGDLIITEIMPNPTFVGDAEGEWFEIYNTTNELLVLNGLTITDEGNDKYQVSDGANPVKIAPHSFFVFGKVADPKVNGGVNVDFQYKSINLSNSSDEIILTSNKGKFIDAVIYNKDSFPTKAGRSHAYDPAGGLNHEANDKGDFWCLGDEPYNEKDYGSPGAFNGACDPNATCEFLAEKGLWNCACNKGYEGPPTNCVDGDDCTPNPCLNGGSCTDDGVNAYSCTCMDGWEGKLCDINIDDCAKNPCLNGGVCTDLVNGYQCSCPAGWSGDNCDINIDDCKENPCQNGGLCVDLVGGFQCKCLEGWEGKLCDISTNPCPEDDKPICKPAGPCQTSVASCGANGWECLGESLIDGSKCNSEKCGDAGICEKGACVCLDPCPEAEKPICQPKSPCETSTATCGDNGWFCADASLKDGSPCNSEACKAEGVCQKGVCECPDPCAGIDCQNGGTCQNGTCDCPEGFGGDLCNIVLDKCKGIDCQNGGVCKDGLCNCPEGWQGTLCEEDVDECANPEKSLCAPNAECVNLLGGFNCECVDGYEGDGFNECSPVDPCAEGDKPVCKPKTPCQTSTATCSADGWICVDASLKDGSDCISNECGDAGTCQQGVCQCNDDPKPKVWKVTTVGFEFDPEELTIAPGDIVAFTTGDNHNAVQVSQETWEKGGKEPLKGGFEVGFGTTEEVTFKEPGIYYYLCQPHAAFMKGKIIVK